jgi:hypothetical protein
VTRPRAALDHLLDGASRIGTWDWAKEQAQSLVDAPFLRWRHVQRVLVQCLICRAEKPDGNREPTENGARVSSALSVTLAKPGIQGDRLSTGPPLSRK